MALAFRSNGTFVAADSTSTGSIGLPAGLANGDILILPIHSRGTGNTVTTPSGYTRAAQVNITAGHRLVVFYKYVTNAAGEAAPNVTHSVSGLIAGRLTAFSGGDATTQLDVAPVTAKHTDLATVTAPTITPATAGTMVIWVFSSGDDNTLNAATQGTTAYSNDTTTGVDGSLALVYELQGAAGPSGTCAMTQSANGPDNWNTVTIALRPSVAAAADPSRTIADSVTLAVEVAFGDSILSAAPTWTDVTADVRDDPGIAIQRGRNSEFSETQPGSLSLTLNNRGRKYDPDYSAGTYFGRLTPLRRIRVRTRYAAVNYTLFDGYIQAWPQRYTPNQEAIVPIAAHDLLTLLAPRSCPPTDLAIAVLTDDPAAYWMFDDQIIVTDQTRNGRDGNLLAGELVGSFLGGEPERQCLSVSGVGGQLVPVIQNFWALRAFKTVTSGRGPSGPSVTFGKAPVLMQRTVIQRSEAVTQRVFTATPGDTLDMIYGLEAWLQFDHIEIGSDFLIAAYADNIAMWFQLGFDADDNPYIVPAFEDATADVTSAFGWHPIQTGRTYHIVQVLSSSQQAWNVYVNGLLWFTGDTSIATFTGGTSAEGFARVEASGQATLKIAHVAVYDTELSATRVAEHYSAGVTGGRMDPVADRADKIQTLIGLEDAGLYSALVFDDNAYMGLGNYSGSILTELQTLNASEQGRLYASKEGVLTFQPRTANWDGRLARLTTSQGTFGDDLGELPYQDLQSDPVSLELMRNIVEVGVYGGTVAVRDQDSVDAYGEQPEGIQTSLSSPEDGRNLGRARLRRFADPGTRVTSLAVVPRKTPSTLNPIVMAAELGNRYTVRRRPQDVGSVIEKEVQLEGLTHNFTTKSWVTTFYLSPAHTTYTQEPWLILGDATYGDIGVAAGNKIAR